jgi:hypothetical protein
VVLALRSIRVEVNSATVFILNTIVHIIAAFLDELHAAAMSEEKGESK